MTVPQAAPARRIPILLCLGLIFVYPLLSLPLDGPLHKLAHRIGQTDTRIVTEAFVWLYTATVLGIAMFWERRTLASIGLRRPSFASLGFGIGGAIAMFALGAVASYVIYFVLHQPQHADQQAAVIVGSSVPYAIALAVRAGVSEEIFYRGLAIEQLTVFTGRRWLSAVIATAVFVTMHALFFDWIQLIPIATVSIVLAALYLWRHDLWANIIAHITVDAVGLITVATQAHKLAH